MYYIWPAFILIATFATSFASRCSGFTRTKFAGRTIKCFGFIASSLFVSLKVRDIFSPVLFAQFTKRAGALSVEWLHHRVKFIGNEGGRSMRFFTWKIVFSSRESTDLYLNIVKQRICAMISSIFVLFNFLSCIQGLRM